MSKCWSRARLECRDTLAGLWSMVAWGVGAGRARVLVLRIVREITGVFPGPSPCLLPKGARGHRTVISRTILTLVVSALFFADRAEAALLLGGDPIGPDSSFTDNTGGFTAVQAGSDNLGLPAILIPFSGQEYLTELRVIVFGLPSSGGNLLFDQFDYRLDLWQSDAYFGGAEPEFSLVLGAPANVTLMQSGLGTVIPDTPFGNAGPFGDDAPTYDFKFDLTNLPQGGPAQQLFDSPLAAGDWVLGFQSWNSIEESGIFRVTGSNAPEGPLPLFSRGDSFPRGVLGGQDPNNLAIRWGMSVSANDFLIGDFNQDQIVSGDDLDIWEETFGDVVVADPSENSDVDEDGDSDGIDFLAWQRHVGISASLPVAVAVPEPGAAWLMLWGIGLGWRGRGDGTGRRGD